MIKAWDISKDALSIASDGLKNDADFMLKLLVMDKRALYYIGDVLKDDAEFMYDVLIVERGAIAHVSDKLKDSAEFMVKALDIDVDNFFYASDRLKADESFKSHYSASLSKVMLKNALNTSVVKVECNLPGLVGYMDELEEEYAIMPLGKKPADLILCFADNFRRWGDASLDCESIMPHNMKEYMDRSEEGVCPVPYYTLDIVQDQLCICSIQGY